MQTPAQSGATDHGKGSTVGTSSSGPPQRTQRRSWWLLWLLAGLLGIPLVLYAAAFAYAFAATQLGPFAPLATGAVLGVLLVIAGPWLLVRQRQRLAGAVRIGGQWCWTRLQTSGLPGRFSGRFP